MTPVPSALRAALLAAAVTAGACSVGNLNYDMVVRDLDAVVEVRGTGPDQQISYRTKVTATAGFAQASLFLPIRPVLLLLFGERVERELDNPSAYVRELLGVLAEKAGDDLLHCADSVQRLVRVAVLDPAPLNRIVAIDGIVTIAEELEFSLLDAVAERGLRLEPPTGAAEALANFSALRPAAREPVGAPLQQADAARYEAALATLVKSPLPHWSQRLALLSDLANAVRDERQRDLRTSARAAMRRSMHYALQWCVLDSVQGRDPALVEIRMRAIEALHRSGGPDSVPLLLAILASPPDQIAAGEPMFEDHDALRLRLVHVCGQLDPERAVASVRLPGRETWQAVAPAEVLVRFALDGDPYFSPVAMPAREALAHCLRKEHARPAEDLDSGNADWIREWFTEFQKQKGQR